MARLVRLATRPPQRGLPSTMSEPSRSNPSPESGAGKRFDACMKVLKDLRDGLVRSGELPFGGLKDTRVKVVLTRSNRNQNSVAEVLPAAYAHLAPVFVAAIVSADPDGGPAPHA